MKKVLIIVGIILLVIVGTFLLIVNFISNELSNANKANTDLEYANKMKAYMEEKYSKTFEIVYTDFSKGAFSRNGAKYSYA